MKNLTFIFLFFCSLLCLTRLQAYRFILPKFSNIIKTSISRKHASIAINDNNDSTQNKLISYYEELQKPINLGPHIKIKGRVLNLWGVYYAIVTALASALVVPFMYLTSIFCDLFGNKKQRKLVDWLVHVWASLTMRGSFCFPKVYGLENLPPMNETVVYVPNHTSFIDILLFSGFIPRPFKYLSKAEILKIPVIGFGMKIAQHIFLNRGDIRSTLECSDACVERLRDKNSMVLFAEGTRSNDGRLQVFKKGAFQIAKAAGVRIVPVSIGNLHRLMPKTVLLPIAPLRHTFIKIHPPIDTVNKTVSEIRAACHQAVNSGLLPYQQHIKIDREKPSSSSSSTTPPTSIE